MAKIIGKNIGDIPGIFKEYAGGTVPANYLLCDGSAISRTTYKALFAAVGTTWGVGDGSTTFNLPDSRGVFHRGAGTNGTLQKANGSFYSGTLGSGQNDQMQGHQHVYNNTSGGYGSGALSATGTPAAGQGQTTSSITSDGSNGTPRSGTETVPANISVTKIIKY